MKSKAYPMVSDTGEVKVCFSYPSFDYLDDHKNPLNLNNREWFQVLMRNLQYYQPEMEWCGGIRLSNTRGNLYYSLGYGGWKLANQTQPWLLNAINPSPRSGQIHKRVKRKVNIIKVVL